MAKNNLVFILIFLISSIIFPQVNEDNLFRDSDRNAFSSIDEINLDTLKPYIIKDDFIVNSFDGDYGAEQRDVNIAMDSSGNYALTWIDFREGEKNVYAQFFNSSGEKLGANIKLNESPINTASEYTTIAGNKNGDYIITWFQDYPNIMARRFNKKGEEIGNIFQLNSGYVSSPPSVIVNNDGSFSAAWASSDIYVKLFDKNGNPITAEIVINEPANFNSHYETGKNIASDSMGNFCVVWSTVRNSYTNIYLQRIDNSGNKIGNNILVNSLSDTSYKHSYQIASTDGGNFLITWKSSLNYEPYQATNAVIYNYNNNFVTEEILLKHDFQHIISDRDSTFFLLWSEENSFGSKIFMQKIRTSGIYLSEKRTVNYDRNNSVFINGFKATDIMNNNLLFALEVRDRDDANIYSQRFNKEFETIGNFIKANDDQGSSYQQKSSVKFNNNGESIILWEDKRNGRNDLYSQIFDKDFNPVGDNIRVNETNADQWQLQDYKVSCLSNGTFITAFSNIEIDKITGASINNTYFQLINTSGEKIGSNQAALTDLYSNHKLSININPEDEILICFYNPSQAFVRKYSKDLSLISSENNLDIQEYNNYEIVAVSVDSLFNILVVWRSYDYQGSSKIMGKFFDGNGKSLSGSFLIESSIFAGDIQCMNDQLNYVVIYTANSKVFVKRKYNLDKEYSFLSEFPNDYVYQPNLYLIEFKNHKIFLTYNNKHSNYNPSTRVLAYYINDNKRERNLYQLYSFEDQFNYYYYDESFGRNKADIFNNKLIFSYESNEKGGTGYDIWTNVQQLDSINFIEESFVVPHVNDILYDNFPNPFNTNTRITYEIAAYHKVKLSVYDILGREVKVLVNQDQEEGLYEVEFDASDLASGIYFYRLEAFDTIVKKMILLK